MGGAGRGRVSRIPPPGCGTQCPRLALLRHGAAGRPPEFADRKRTTQVDGETQNGWFASDFTLAEIKALGAVATDSERPHQYDGRYSIATFQEIIDLVQARNAESGRTVAIYPETKNPTYHRDLGLPLRTR